MTETAASRTRTAAAVRRSSWKLLLGKGSMTVFFRFRSRRAGPAETVCSVEVGYVEPGQHG